jgi:Fe-S cluster assembly iron-binding protein IscA
MSITLTEKAAKHVSRFIEKRGKGIGLRFGVRTTGCSGLEPHQRHPSSPSRRPPPVKGARA